MSLEVGIGKGKGEGEEGEEREEEKENKEKRKKDTLIQPARLGVWPVKEDIRGDRLGCSLAPSQSGREGTSAA